MKHKDGAIGSRKGDAGARALRQGSLLIAWFPVAMN